MDFKKIAQNKKDKVKIKRQEKYTDKNQINNLKNMGLKKC